MTNGRSWIYDISEASKEQARKEKRLQKLARRQQRKQDAARGDPGRKTLTRPPEGELGEGELGEVLHPETSE